MKHFSWVKFTVLKITFSAGCPEGELILYLSTLDCSLSILLKKEIFKTPCTFFQEIWCVAWLWHADLAFYCLDFDLLSMSVNRTKKPEKWYFHYFRNRVYIFLLHLKKKLNTFPKWANCFDIFILLFLRNKTSKEDNTQDKSKLLFLLQ